MRCGPTKIACEVHDSSAPGDGLKAVLKRTVVQNNGKRKRAAVPAIGDELLEVLEKGLPSWKIQSCRAATFATKVHPRKEG